MFTRDLVKYFQSMRLSQAVSNVSDRAVIISGPCSAESYDQMMRTAEGLLPVNPDLFRAGIWKPRTRPGSFEGIGNPALKWLNAVQDNFGFRVTTEVASSDHVKAALDAGIDVLWIGARTTTNPFSVQEIADALEGTDIPVLVKNPINPDIHLWIGAIERLYKAGLRSISAIHRGFSQYGETTYRNSPMWMIPMELKSRVPDLQLICDISHISGNRHLLEGVAQTAMNLQFDGLMIESHINPSEALSDAAQQLVPLSVQKLIDKLAFRKDLPEDNLLNEKFKVLRKDIDVYDRQLLEILGKRMALAESIGHLKMANNIAIYQPKRWEEVLRMAHVNGDINLLSIEFVDALYNIIHQESILRQNKLM